jgi:N-acetylmuramoyl-L-alanine amidase
MATVQVRNRLRRSETVAGASLRLTRQGLPQPVTATTNSNGTATLTTTGLASGAYTLTVTPQHTDANPVGPTTATATTADRIFRTLVIDVTVTAGAITAATVAAGNTANGTVALAHNQPLAVTLQPVWMRSPHHRARGLDISGIIVHHTGGATIGGALEQFLHGGTSAHYVIDTDGQIVKMVQDVERASHAGVAKWNEDTNVNARTIGIEIVNATAPYPLVQLQATTDLLSRLRTAFPTIVPWNVVGHSDVATDDNGRLGRKSSDPGLKFEWVRVEALGLGMIASTAPIAPTIYGSFFVSFPNESLRQGDNDTRRKFGGAVRQGISGNLVQELQADLRTIGYTVGALDGDFGGKTRAAVEMFQEHFFAGGRGHKAPDGRVDRQTATLIKAVVVSKALSLVGAGAAAGAVSGGGGS